MLNSVKHLIAKSPLIRATINFVFIIVSGVLCSAFVTEINTLNGLSWMLFYKTKTFYLIIALFYLFYLYNKFLYKLELNINAFISDEYCKAYVRSQCLPALANKYRELIEKGESSDDVKEIHQALKGLIK